MPYCTNCGTEVEHEERFCSNCEQPLAGGQAAGKGALPKKKGVKKRFKPVLIGLVAALLLLGGAFLFPALFGDDDFASTLNIEALDYTYFRPTSPDQNITDPETGFELVAGEVVVVAEDGVTFDEMARVLEKVNGRIIGGGEELGVYQVEIPGDDAISVRFAAETLKDLPTIKAAFPNYVLVSLDAERTIPDVPQWTGRDQAKRWGQEYINLPRAWTIATGAPALKVGVIDKGFDPRHPDLEHLEVRAGDLEWYRKIGCMVWRSRMVTHGNAVAGIIGAAAHNREGMAGVVWELELYGYISNALTDFGELLKAAHRDGVRVVNISLGGPWANEGEVDLDLLQGTNAALERIIDTLDGVLLVTSAGNNPNVPVEQMPLASLAAARDDVLTVGAIDSKGKRAEFSTYGHGVNVAAPGTKIWSATATDTFYRNLFWVRWANDAYSYHQGTSIAATFVTGVAALIWSVNPDLSPAQVKEIIISTADLHDFDRPLGSGVVNAFRALEKATQEEEEAPLSLPKEPISPENAAEVTQLTRWGKGNISEAVFSPDGRILAVASSIGVYLYDALTLEEVLFIDTDRYVLSVSFSSDGALLASGSGDNTVRLWRVSDGLLVRTLEGHESYVVSASFSPDGVLLASGSGDNTVRLWRVSDGTLVRTLEGHKDSVRSVSFSPDGALLASGSGDNTVRLWRVSDGSLLRTLEGHESYVFSVSFSPDGALLASGSLDNTVRLWRIFDGTLMRTLEGQTGHVSSVSFSPDGALLTSGSWDNTVRLWRVSDGLLVRTLEGHTDSVLSVSFSPDGALLASGSDDGTVRLWRVSDGLLVRTLERHTDRLTSNVYSVSFSPDGALLASGSWDNTVRLWRVSDGSLVRILGGFEYVVSSVSFSPDGALLALGSDDGAVRLWRISDGTLVRTLEGHESYVFSVSFSPDGELLASGSWEMNGAVFLWRLSDGSLVRVLEGYRGSVSIASFSPDGVLLASVYSDTVRLWRVSDGLLVRTLEGHTDSVLSVSFSPDGALLASGSWDGTVRLWRVSDGTLVRILEGHTGSVPSVSFSPDGLLLASCSPRDYGSVRLWRVSEGTLVRILAKYTSYVSTISFSPDGALLASGSYDGTVRLWGVAP